MGVWNLEPKNSDPFSMAAVQVVQMLMGKVKEAEKDDIDELVQTFTEYLEANAVLHKMRLVDAIHMGFSMGYYYRLFLEKNKVQFRSTYVKQPSGSDDEPPTSKES